MHWVAPSGKDSDNAALEKRLWDAADMLMVEPTSSWPTPSTTPAPPSRISRQLIESRAVDVMVADGPNNQRTLWN